MKNTALFSMLIVAIIVMAGAFVYFQVQKTSGYPDYHVNMYLNATNLTYYPIHVNSNLTGNGTYQQLLTLSDPSHYNINANGSNLAFYDGSNNTHLYAWIQSINTTSMQVWVKNYYGNSVIDMQVLPSFENLFSANGYLGFNSTYFNAPIVFNGNAWNYQSNFSDWIYTGPVSASVSGTLVNISFSDDSNGNTWWLGYGNYANGSVMREYVVFTNNSNLGAGFAGSGYSIGIVHNNSLFTETQGAEIPTQGEVIIGFHGGFASPASYMLVKYLFVVPSLTKPTFTIGTFTNMTDHADVSYLSNSITIPMPNWFNLTLMAYTNYSFTFQYNNTPLYFTYDGLINNTIYTGFLDHNLTLDIHFIALGYSGKTELIVGEKK